MKKYLLFLLLFPLLCISASELTPKGEQILLVLSESGRTDYTIIYAENAKGAAQLLRDNLKIICKGVDFPLISENDAVKPPFISVGQTKLASNAGVGKMLPDRTSIEIKVVDKNLFLYANKDPLHAVVNFLEGDVGCRFFTDKIIYRPSLDELKIQIVNRCETAAYEDRCTHTDPDLNYNWDWSTYNKVLRWEHFRHPRQMHSHTYQFILPPTEFKRHPERFAVVNGKPDSRSICPTHPENIAAFKKNIREFMEKYPDKKYFAVAENDGVPVICRCQRCSEIISKHCNAPIAPHIYLVNEVAKFVADKAPKQLVEFPVYHIREIPVDLEIEPNVNLWYCVGTELNSNYSEKIMRHIIPEIKKKDGEKQVRLWREKVNHMTVWDYSVDYGNYFRVVPTLYAMWQNLKLFEKYNCEGYFMCDYFGYRAGDQQRLRAWVFAKLFWNPNLNMDNLAREYCYGVYAAAAPERYQYYELVQRAGRAGKTIENFYGVQTFVNKAGKLFKAALPKVRNNPTALRELEMDYMPILITELDMIFKNYPANKNKFSQKRYQYLLSEVKRISKEYKMDKIAENDTMAGYIAEREMLLQLSNNNGIFETRACNVKVFGYSTVNDSLAEGGKATRSRCNDRWDVGWYFPVNLFDLKCKYQLIAEMRVEKKSNLKEACQVGVYNGNSTNPNKRDLSESIDGKLLSDTEYRFIKIGKPFLISQGKRNSRPFVYFCAPNTSDIGALYVNRIRLIKVK